MASVMQQGNRFYCQFMCQGKRHYFALGNVSRPEAEAKINQADYMLMRLSQGLLQVPAGMGIVPFLQFDGKSPQNAPLARDAVTLGKLRDRYLDVHRGSLEQTTVDGIALHFRHLVSILGEGFPIQFRLANFRRLGLLFLERVAACFGVGDRVSSPQGASAMASPGARKGHAGKSGESTPCDNGEGGEWSPPLPTCDKLTHADVDGKK